MADGRIVWSRGYGWANIASAAPVTPDTDFMLASISKTVMATAAMQAVEDGLLALDADVNAVLPFAVRNPGHPAVPITLRRLLTHTASLRDNWGIWDHFYSRGDSAAAPDRVDARQDVAPLVRTADLELAALGSGAGGRSREPAGACS